MRKSNKLTILFSMLLVISLACSFSGSSGDAPVVVIVLPADGETVMVGQVVNVVTTTSSEVGLDKVELLINGQLISTDTLSDSPSSHSSNFSWVPAAEGAVVLGVVGYDTGGNASAAALRTVQVSAGGGALPSNEPSVNTQPPTEQTVMCTPPACGANESYYCPGACPGGCGITCATFTPTNPPPNTATFTPHPPTWTFTPSPTNTTMFIPSIQFVVSLQVLLLTSVETYFEQVTIPAGEIGNTTAFCPTNSKVVSGGYAGNPTLFVYSNKRSGDGWRVFAQNNGSSAKPLSVYVRCLTNTSGTTTQYQAAVQVSAGSFKNLVKTCPAGSIVTGGGFATNSNGNVPVYNSSMSGNGWQIWAQNNAGGDRQITVYVSCLEGVNATTYQTSRTFNVSANSTTGGYTECNDNDLAVGGGYAAQKYFYMYNTSPTWNSKTEWSGYASNPGSSSMPFYNYAVCLTFN